MRRVLVMGCSGAGKSTFARRLGARTGVPVIHLDAEYWQPGWVGMPEDQWHHHVDQLIARDAWVMDGSYPSTLAARLARADTVVVFDFPRRTCLWGIARRIARFHGRTRPDLGRDCPERIDVEFLRWVWTFRARVWPQAALAISEARAWDKVVWLRSRREAEAYVRAAAAAPDAAASSR